MTPSATPNALERLKTQRDKLDARIRQTEALDKAQLRKQALQRKVLVGTFILEQAQREGRYTDLVAQLDGYLIRANDRQLFDLPPQVQASLLTELGPESINTAKGN